MAGYSGVGVLFVLVWPKDLMLSASNFTQEMMRCQRNPCSTTNYSNLLKLCANTSLIRPRYSDTLKLFGTINTSADETLGLYINLVQSITAYTRYDVAALETKLTSPSEVHGNVMQAKLVVFSVPVCHN